MNTQNAPRPIDALKSLVNAESTKDQLTNALGSRQAADAFGAQLLTLATKDPNILQCNPIDVIKVASEFAALKMPISTSLGYAYIVPFGGRPSFILGYKGWIQLAERSGQYKTINADIVYEGEISHIDKLSGEIHFDGTRKSDKVVGYFAYFRLLNGTEKTLYTSVEDMAKFAKKYSKGISKSTTVEQLIALANTNVPSTRVGWEGDFNKMAIKTVIKHLLSTYGVLSTDMQRQMESEAEAPTDTETQRAPQRQTINVDELVVEDEQPAAETPQPEF